VLTGAPDPREQAMLSEILSRVSTRPVDLGGQLSLPELAALTARAKAFVGVDSAPMHIAAAVGTPAVAAVRPERRRRVGAVDERAPDRCIGCLSVPPCGNDGCGGSKVSDCLTTLPVARVHSALRELVPLGGSSVPA
jgi:heptosyltransferase-3